MGGAAVAVMARGRLPEEGPLWLTPGPPEPGVHALRPFDGHLGNVSVRAEERLVVSMGDEVFHDAPLCSQEISHSNGSRTMKMYFGLLIRLRIAYKTSMDIASKGSFKPNFRIPPCCE